MSTTFEVLAEPNRRRILDLLVEAERPVGDLVSALDVSQPAVSKHLRVLRDAGLVEVRGEAQRRIYRVRAGTAARPRRVAARRIAGCGRRGSMRSRRTSTRWRNGNPDADREEIRKMTDTTGELGTLDRDGERFVLTFRRRLAHPPERVWRALTEPEHLEHWFPTTIDGERAAGARAALLASATSSSRRWTARCSPSIRRG